MCSDSTIGTHSGPCHIFGEGFTSSFLPSPAKITELRNITRSGASPSEASESHFQTTISAAQAELGRCDTEITGLQNELERLTSERRALASYAEECRGLSSPIRRIPPELLAKIFDICRPENLYGTPRSMNPDEEVDRGAGRHLLQLAQVSSRSHDVVMGTAALWSKIALEPSLWGECAVSAATLLSLLRTSLDRGGNHPLTLQVVVSQYAEYRYHKQSVRHVLELLCTHASRWRDVYLSSDADLRGYLTGVRGNLGRLERLHFAALWDGTDTFLDEDGQTFRDAPRLTQVALSGLEFFNGAPDLPWPQIVRLTYLGEGFQCLYPLRHAHNIATSSFNVDLLAVSPDVSWPLISSNVQKLSLMSIADNPLVIGQMFDSLTLPSLESLDFLSRDDESPLVLPPDHFLALADRSWFANHLTYLGIYAIVTDTELLRCLEALPQLERLFISDCAADETQVVITDSLLRGLAYSSSPTALISRLCSLSLRSLLRFTDTVLVDTVTSRIDRIGRPFETALVWPAAPEYDLSSETVNELAALALGGGLVFSWERSKVAF